VGETIGGGRARDGEGAEFLTKVEIRSSGLRSFVHVCLYADVFCAFMHAYTHP